MFGKVIVALAACAAFAAPFALAQSGTEKDVQITESEWGIAGVPATVKAGTQLRITVTNKGGVLHELVLENGNCTKQCAVKLKGHNLELENLAPGASKSAVWKLTKAGSYTFTCRKPGHWKAGMRKTFTVA
ncbi:MAG TPA: plastocyanin/azurin family copper-binding protein [Gaiellales bacterium]|jgi:uncharacterized cupredoxin-like copper-binding protein|nr:plastocyanin/azurin family copper-binding protein [Gaiellales bacterium]